jgi:hypothetical protein
LGVTRSLGYVESGTRRMLRNDEAPDRMIGFEMSRAYFEEHVRRSDVELVGVEPVCDLLAIS